METIYCKIQKLLDDSQKPLEVKFIRLGGGGKLFPFCKEKKLIYFGFSSEKYLELANSLNKVGDISKIEEKLKQEIERLGEAKTKSDEVNKQKSGNVLRQVQDFFKDSGNTLWVTSYKKNLYFNFTDGGDAFSYKGQEFPDTDQGMTMKRMQFEWTCLDKSMNPINPSMLNGGIKKTLNYRGTICDFKSSNNAGQKIDYAKLLLQRILCIETELRKRATDSYLNFMGLLEHLIKQFEERDFELLIELIFSRSGFKRNGVAGKQEEVIDIELSHPIDEKVYAVQIKSHTDKMVFKEWVDDFNNYNETFGHIGLFVYHSGKIDKNIQEKNNIEVWDAPKIAQLALNNGLADWVIQTAPV